MALSTYALVSLEELKRHLNVSGNEKNALLEEIINRASDLIEQFLGRHVVTRGDVTEYHSPPDNPPRAELTTRDHPIIAVTSIYEDTGWPLTYGANYLLVDGTDYAAVKPDGLLRRMDSGGLRAWAPGFRTVKVVYSYGYTTIATVPDRIKAPALKLCALFWAEATRQQFGISGASDSAGNWTRFAPASLTPDIKRDLGDEQRLVFESTAERDS